MIFSSEFLFDFIFRVFKLMNSSDEDARMAAKVLCLADLRGVDSHGVARLSGYVRLWEQGRLNANPNIHIVHETPSTAVIDGDAGAGLVVAPRAMQIAIEKAKNVGTGWVAVKNSNHYGIAAAHAMLALEHDMIGWSMTNASPLVVPTFSKSKYLGTNPISVAIPAGKQPPIVIDMATTTVANGKLEMAQRKGKDIPYGWAVDKDGNPTQSAFALKNGGAMLPLGGVDGGHKGYCFGSLVDILSGVLSGANYGPWVPPFVSFLDVDKNGVGEGIGHFLGAMRIDAFRPAEDFKTHMDNWITTFRNAETIDGHEKVLIPGDPERLLTEDRQLNGIDLLDPVIDDLKSLATKFDIRFSNK
jgi:LDH2 family malate/lactate/ureidoglycolate dehydrogenase